MIRQLQLVFAFGVFFSVSASPLSALEPWTKNPWYWSHAGQPVLLLGGSDDDNLFQWPEDQLTPQLERLSAAGGNVIRNTMSDRKDQGFETYPFLQLESGKYDLTQWNLEYWNRFERLLRETAKRGIFVQVEIWDRFDYTDHQASDRWQIHPFNPGNNVNYSYAESGFAPRYPDHPGSNKQPFFYSTPKQRNNAVVLDYQNRFVHKLLDHTLKYDHVLYCMDNETKADPEWGQYWAELVKHRARAAGKRVMATEMWDDWDLKAARHRETFDHPELYDFVDVSQNNHNSGQLHWDNFLYVRKYLSDKPRPMNTTKTYGADGNKFGHTDQDAIERFWRHLLAGAASIRFHRPDSGLGLNDQAVACIRAARELEQRIPLWSVHAENEILGGRKENECYAAASESGSAYVLFFPASNQRAEVTLDFRQSPGDFQVSWINIDTGELAETGTYRGSETVAIRPPNNGNFAAAVTRALEATDGSR